MTQSLGEKIRKVREFRKISLEDLSKKTGYSKEFLGGLEDGSRMTTLGTLMVIAKGMGLRVGTFLDELFQSIESAVSAKVKSCRSLFNQTMDHGLQPFLNFCGLLNFPVAAKCYDHPTSFLSACVLFPFSKLLAYTI